MPVWWAKFLYWRSIGWDMTEVPEARQKERERLVRLHRRIGDAEMRKFLIEDDKRRPSIPRTPQWFGRYCDPEWY